MASSTDRANNYLNVYVGNLATSALLLLGRVGLNIGSPTVTGTGGAEASGGGYAPVNVSSSNFGNASAASVTNSESEIAFPDSTGAISSGSSITHARFETSGGTTFLGFLALSTSRQVNDTGVTLRFAQSALTFSVA